MKLCLFLLQLNVFFFFDIIFIPNKLYFTTAKHLENMPGKKTKKSKNVNKKPQRISRRNLGLAPIDENGL